MNGPDPDASPTVHRVSFEIPRDHPSLAGHFPDHPMVPGVLLLDRVLDAAAAWPQTPPGPGIEPLRLSQVKFLAPLQPGRPAETLLTRTAGKLSFRIEQDGRVLAQGVFAPSVY